MIKIKKVSIENFKGIKEKTVFDFEKDAARVNILSGPNGFGKTSLFEAIEVCLTGSFERTKYFDGVQNKSGKNKPYFQNTDGENVLIKLWLVDDNRNHIIIKYYDDDNQKRDNDFKRQNIPINSPKYLKTYYSTDEAYFERNDNFGEEQTSQFEIDSILLGENTQASLTASYLLFNYIQQEDSKRFLRQNEGEKGKSIGFLINIEKEEAEKQRLEKLIDYLKDQEKELNRQIKALEDNLPEVKESQYNPLFSWREFDFDKEKPFGNPETARDQITIYRKELDELNEFIEIFSVSEFKKSLSFQQLNAEVLSNERILNAILLSSIYTPELQNELQKKNEKLFKAESFKKSNETDLISKEYFELFLENWEPIYAEYEKIELAIKVINQDLGDVGKIISELNKNRENTLKEFNKIKNTKHITETNCPLCDTNFTSYALLEEAINSKTDLLELFNKNKLNQKRELELKVKEYYAQILEKIIEFIEINKSTDQWVLGFVREYSSIKPRVDELFQRFDFANNPGVVELLFSKVPPTQNDFKERNKKLQSFIAENILTKYAYNESLLVNKHLFQQYFDLDATKFERITSQLIKEKLEYLQGEYTKVVSSRLSFLLGQKETLDGFKGKIDGIYEKVFQTIKKHSEEMIRRIQIPFYVYSGKILQSYQQGQGIFVKIESTNQKIRVIFKTGHQSDHDIVYHLSTGQLDVVAIAFCLSLNKVYNTNENFKFLAIDDPVKTMDDLNVHTFIELLRNEFSDYQIIMSTHDDFTSRYMKYKFDKVDGMKTQIQNVQNVVLQALN